ncbi:hypothetical protein K435DRAFT_868848 [Dendrothele bispora CBS 962.96]|uniref:Uncharacterized protein n=1 Tax=Dendrothele bispora (strain CBS 962.96) TaxID=1314807 RepID=A0A4S8LAS4_DENBC|nr:hypothetical protein K435DRAFT_868848 [Dendrothele bispora CBS 962.96]
MSTVQETNTTSTSIPEEEVFQFLQEVALFVKTYVELCSALFNSDIPLDDRLTLANNKTSARSITIPLNVLSTLMLLAGDLVMVWRTWVIWTGNGFVRSIIVLLMLANIALNLVPASTELNSPASNKLSVAIMFLSFFTNAVATSLIYFKAWLHQRMFKELKEKRKTDVTRILYLLVESGALYGIIQAIYPVAVIILIYTRRSYVDEITFVADPNIKSNGGIGSSMRFAVIGPIERRSTDLSRSDV